MHIRKPPFDEFHSQQTGAASSSDCSIFSLRQLFRLAHPLHYSSAPHTLHRRGRTHPEAASHIYSEEQLTTFLERVSHSNDTLTEPGWDFSGVLNQESIKRVRFLLGTDSKLCFARSETPTREIPAHSQMAKDNSPCLAAGDFYFAKIADKWTLIGASNKSGDFKPGIQSLQFALLRLQQQSTPFSEQLQIEVQGEVWLGCFSRVFQFNIKEINEYLLELASHLQNNKDDAIESSETTPKPKKPKLPENQDFVVQLPPSNPNPPVLPTPQPQPGSGRAMVDLFGAAVSAARAARAATDRATLPSDNALPPSSRRKLF